MDDRYITRQQRGNVMAILRLIFKATEHKGSFADYYHKIKLYYSDIMDYTLEEPFSLKDKVCTYQEYIDYRDWLVELIFQLDIPIEHNFMDLYDDLTNWGILCIKHKKCAVCGRSHSDMHHAHSDKIGMGNNRKAIDDSKRSRMALCRGHHNEAHQIGDQAFCKKYHVKAVVCKYHANVVDMIDFKESN